MGVLSFQSCNPLSMHAISHSYFPFPNLFVHVIVFYNPWHTPKLFGKLN